MTVVKLWSLEIVAVAKLLIAELSCKRGVRKLIFNLYCEMQKLFSAVVSLS